MRKKIVVLEGSSRKGGNTDLLSDELIRGALESGHEVKKFYLAQENIHPCMGCNACRRSEEHNCVFRERDGFEKIVQAVIAADVLVLASPVYFYSLTAQMKTALDRFYARMGEIHDKTASLVTACLAPSGEYIETAKACFRGFIACVGNIREGGVAAGFGTSEKGDVKKSPAMQAAYQMGCSI